MKNEPKENCEHAIVRGDFVFCEFNDKPCSNYDTEPCEDYQERGD